MKGSSRYFVTFTLLFAISIVITAQEVTPKYITATPRKVSFGQIEAYDKLHPVLNKPHRFANEEEDEEEGESKRIDLPVDETQVKPFAGRQIDVSARAMATLSINACNNFRALDDNGVTSPPDTHGAAGFDHLMTVLNSEVRIQDKQGTVLSTVSLVNFFNGSGHADVFDPKVTYDPYWHRWIFVACASRRSANSALLIAVSQTYDPLLDWNMYSIDAEPGDTSWLDYPLLGFNSKWIAIGGNMFPIPGVGSTQRARVFAIDKLVVYAGNAITIPIFDQPTYLNICPAVTYSTTEANLWCVSVHNANANNNGYVRLFSISGTAASPSFAATNIVALGSPWAKSGVGAPQSGTATTIDLGDDRIQQAVVRNGRIWFSGHVFLPVSGPSYAGIRFAGITLSDATGYEVSTLADNTGNTMYGYPSLCVNQSDEKIWGFTIFKTTAFPTAATLVTPAIVEFKAGEDWYVSTDGSGKNRWGDYSATCIDPEDDKTMWSLQEYSRTRVGANSFWGTWWHKVCNTVCSADLTHGAVTIPAGILLKYEVSNTITSSITINSGAFIKYDAGTRVRLLPGFRANNGSKLRVVIDGCGGIQ